MQRTLVISVKDVHARQRAETEPHVYATLLLKSIGTHANVHRGMVEVACQAFGCLPLAAQQQKSAFQHEIEHLFLGRCVLLFLTLPTANVEAGSMFRPSKLKSLSVVGCTMHLAYC